MTGLSLVLNNALSGLNVNQSALAVLSQNIANANTKGYSKQIVNQESLYLDGNGQGVSIKEVTRKIDTYLLNAVQTQNSIVGQANTVSNFQDRIQILLGQPGSQTNISSYVDTFFNAVQSLSQTPENATLQQGVVNSGSTLAAQIKQLAQGLHDLQLQADRDIKTAVDNINSDLKNIFDLNNSIATAKVLGQSTADLEDKRDGFVNHISSYLDINVVKRDSGAISITTGSGVILLGESFYKLGYDNQPSANAFITNNPIQPVTVTRLDNAGNPAAAPATLISGGTSSTIVSAIATGEVKGLLLIRDKQIPALLNQLDTMASSLRDQLNAIHNTGSGFPPASSYTGTRLVGASDATDWNGKLRIAILDSKGLPVASPYATQSGGGLVPLTIDLTTLDSGDGEGLPTTQTIIDEINQYFGVPQNKLQLGNLDNIRLASKSATLPGNPASFQFDFDLSNRSATGSNFYLTNVTVKDDGDNDVASVTSAVPSITLASTATYVTTGGSNTVVVNTASAHGLQNGAVVFLSTPPGDVDGIAAGNLGGFFTISNATSSSFEITAATAATSGASTNVASQTALPPYSSVAAGGDERTGADGLITADLTGSTTSQYYTITADVAVDDGTGNITTSTVTYRINSLRSNVINERAAAVSATGDATVLNPQSLLPIASAILVDANGVELAKVNGKYSTTAMGYLSIRSNISGQSMVIDSLDSAEIGKPGKSPAVPGSNRSFSHYFELNNFFKSNVSTATGDTLAGSAYNLAVESRITSNPNLISMGMLVRTTTTDPNSPALYTYERHLGDSSIVRKLSDFGASAISFAAATGLAATSQTFSGYAGSIIGVTAQQSASAANAKETAQVLFDGFSQRANSISGVNLDTELANTIIYQNAYAASARVITVTNTLFDALLQTTAR